MEQENHVQGLDEEAFYHLIQEKKAMLYRIAFVYTRNENDAIEIVQETVYKAYVSLKKLKDPNYFTTWVTRILINSAIDCMRKKKRTIPISEHLIASAADLEKGSSEERLDLWDAISGLEEKYKTVIILKYYRDLTVSEIAEILDCPVGTVKTHLQKALKKLRLEIKGGDCVNE